MADLLATAVVYHADEFVGPVFAMDPVVIVVVKVAYDVKEVSYRLAMAVLSSGDKSADSEVMSTHRSDGGGACGDHGGGQSKLTEKGQEIPRNFDVEKSVERTKNAGN